MLNNHHGPIVAHNADISVIDCSVCGYAHVDPLPAQAEVDAYYGDDAFYKTHGAPDALAKEWREGVRGDWDSAYRYQTELIRRYGGRNLLDIGCGTGWFMDYYQRENPVAHVLGIEPSPSALRWSPVPQLIYANARMLPDLAIDSVRMALVLEHVLDPVQMLTDTVENYMSADGVLMAIVPNEFNPLQRRLVGRVGNDWYVQKPHINYFSKKSISALFRNSGLRVVHQSGTFPMEISYTLGYKYIGNDTIGRKCHRKRLDFERRLGVSSHKMYEILYKWLGWGRESIVIGKRA